MNMVKKKNICFNIATGCECDIQIGTDNLDFYPREVLEGAA